MEDVEVLNFIPVNLEGCLGITGEWKVEDESRIKGILVSRRTIGCFVSESGGLLAGTLVVRLVLGISRREQENCDGALFPKTKMKE